PNSDVEVSMMGACAATVTVCSEEPTSNVKSIAADWLTERTKSLCLAVWNPVLAACKSYWPGWTLTKTYSPDALDMVVKLTPVARLLSWREAFGTFAPELSRTMPCTVAVETWAASLMDNANTARAILAGMFILGSTAQPVYTYPRSFDPA